MLQSWFNRLRCSMDQCEKLAQVEGYVAGHFLEHSEHEVHALTNLLSKESYMNLLNSDRKFKKLHTDMEDIYKSAVDFGLRIEPDKFGGYCLVNRSGNTIKCGEINCAVGLLGRKSKGHEIDDWSSMEGEKLVVGVARWANHLCVPNCDYYMKSGFRGRECVRLRALSEIKDGEELLTYYNDDFFGTNNMFCLCGHESKHGMQVLTESVQQDNLNDRPPKRKRIAKPRIKVMKDDERGSLLVDLATFYNEDSNASIVSETSSISVVKSPDPEWELTESEELEQEDDEVVSDVSCSDISLSFEQSEEFNHGIDLFRDYSLIEEGDESGTQEADEENQLFEIAGASATNLAASLLAIVSLHNGSDALLSDLLKRDQLLFAGQTISPWAFRKQFENFCAKYQSSKQSFHNGELILLSFRPLLLNILRDSLADIFKYAEDKEDGKDILMPKLRIEKQRLKIRLIVNTDGANVCKTPMASAWPMFFAIADLPPKQRQLFKNLVLGALFVGAGYPDFDVVFEHVQKELSVDEEIEFKGACVSVTFEPILFVADLIAKSKVLKMKQCNGYYGCTLCTQRGNHVGGAHRYPHDEVFVMRSFSSHLMNVQELEKGSVEKLKERLGRNADCEVKTHGVKGLSKAFDIISNLPLSSPVDPMHQLFLGVGKDLLLYHYERMRPHHREEINSFLSSLDVPKEFKNMIRPLDALSNFKAKEVKVMLLYLSPIVFPLYLFGDERKSDETDLNKLVFSIRELYESSKNADFCERLLSEFCVSMAEKTNKMESINFHILRHLGWQAKNIGPLFTTSAAMFESANRLLIAPLTGTVNQCQLMVWRFIRAKMIATMKLKEDCLTSMLTDFLQKKKFDEAYGFVDNTDTRKFCRERPQTKLFCLYWGDFFLSSAAYGRGCLADRYVAVWAEDEFVTGEILFFSKALLEVASFVN